MLALAFGSGHSTYSHTKFHTATISLLPKYPYKVLHGEVRPVSEIVRLVCVELRVTVVTGALSRDHVQLFVEIPSRVAASEFVRRAEGRSSRKIQQEFEHIRKRYRGERFWQRGYFSTTSGNITDDVIEN